MPTMSRQAPSSQTGHLTRKPSQANRDGNKPRPGPRQVEPTSSQVQLPEVDTKSNGHSRESKKTSQVLAKSSQRKSARSDLDKSYQAKSLIMSGQIELVKSEKTKNWAKPRAESRLVTGGACDQEQICQVHTQKWCLHVLQKSANLNRHCTSENC